jgi:polar amino acid transport system permease protein
MFNILQVVLYIGSGVVITLELLFGGFVIGFILGLVFSVIQYSNRICKLIIKSLVSVIRGIPLILQIGLIYFSLPTVLGIRLNVISAGVIAFGINSSAYMAEIFRAGIESIPRGQFEAAKTLNIPSFYMWKDIILPQVVRNIFPAIVNEIVSLLKETAIISTIGGLDIMRASQMVAAQQFEYFMPLCIAGAYYYTLVLVIEFIGRKVEQRIKS